MPDLELGNGYLLIALGFIAWAVFIAYVRTNPQHSTNEEEQPW